MDTQRVRASDEEREQFATILRAAMGEGRLSLADGEERIAAAYAATYRDELGPLTADLPDGGRRALYDTPEVRTSVRQTVRRNWVCFAIVAAGLVGLWALSGTGFFWPIIPLVLIALAMRRRAHWHRYAATRGWSARYGAGEHPGRPPWHDHHRQRHSADRW